MAGPDPRTSSATIKALAAAPTDHGPRARQRVRPGRPAARAGSTPRPPASSCPAAVRSCSPGAGWSPCTGIPGDTVLGALGEQPLDATVTRAQQVAAELQRAGERAGGADLRDHRDGGLALGRLRWQLLQRGRRSTLLKPWVDAARAAGIYVVLDLQPGRIGLPQPGQALRRPAAAAQRRARARPGVAAQARTRSTCSRSARSTRPRSTRPSAWLADLTRANHLPQKVFMVHQFRLDMITNRATLVTDYDELRVVIHVDGFGTPGAEEQHLEHAARRRAGQRPVGLEELLRRGQADLHPAADHGQPARRRSSSPTNDPRCVHRCLGGVRGHGRPGLVITRTARPRPRSSAPAAPGGLRG